MARATNIAICKWSSALNVNPRSKSQDKDANSSLIWSLACHLTVSLTGSYGTKVALIGKLTTKPKRRNYRLELRKNRMASKLFPFPPHLSLILYHKTVYKSTYIMSTFAFKIPEYREKHAHGHKGEEDDRRSGQAKFLRPAQGTPRTRPICAGSQRPALSPASPRRPAGPRASPRSHFQ